MDNVVNSFVENLKKKPDVLGVILFGSWARGNNRPDSDVDLMIILEDGFKRTVEYQGGRAFEITYTTEKSAMEYWNSHKDDCFGFWEVAKILYDKNGVAEKLKESAKAIIERGKDRIDEIKVNHLKFDVEDSLEAVKALAEKDSSLANFLISNKIFWLSELFFDLRQLWIPAPKQRFSKIKEVNPQLYDLLAAFYREDVYLPEKIEIYQKIISLVF